MVRWAVILSVTALCFCGVSSQMNITETPKLETSSSESDNTSHSASKITFPTELSPSTDDSEVPTKGNFVSSSFPPLVHNPNPPAAAPQSPPTEIPISTQEPVKVPVTTQEVKTSTEKMMVANNEPTSPPTTAKPNSSNALQGSLIVLLVGVLVWKLSLEL